jgi:hypothetical protein
MTGLSLNAHFIDGPERIRPIEIYFWNLPIEELYCIRAYIQNFPDWVDNEINNSNNKHSLRRDLKGYGGKTH